MNSLMVVVAVNNDFSYECTNYDVGTYFNRTYSGGAKIIF